MELMWGALGIIALFAVVIWLGLRVRKTQMARSLRLSAQDVWAPFARSQFERDALLYGIRQDLSMVETELLVRDSKGEQVGQIVWHGGTRTNYLSLSTDEGSYSADTLPTFSWRTVLHPADDASKILCMAERSWTGVRRFHVTGEGVFTSRRRTIMSLAPICDITRDGVLVGASQHIGGAVDRGVMLILPPSIPLHVRMFILALQ